MSACQEGSIGSHERLDHCLCILDQVTDTICAGDALQPGDVSCLIITVAEELRNLTDEEFEELKTFTEIRDKLMSLSSLSTV